MTDATLTRSIETPKAERSKLRPIVLRLDMGLLAAVLALTGCSLVAISGATSNDIPGNPLYYVERQTAYILVGLILMYLMSRINLSRVFEYRKLIYTTLLVTNLLVFLLATATRGSKRWIELPFFRFQPSELGKILLILALAAFVVERSRYLSSPKVTARLLAIGALPAVIVMGQPDLGTALVYGMSVIAVLFLAGTPWRHLGVIVGVAAVTAVLSLTVLPHAGIHVLKPYQVSRLTSFINPSNDPGDESYQLLQSKIAIGSGEKAGRGVRDATQTALNFLPEHHTDFIFAVIGETYGFAGAAMVLSLYALLIWRGLHIITFASDLYTALIAGGISVMFLYQVFVNVGMTVGIMPVTGVPAPLLSFGGSSMLVSLMAIGLLQAVHAHSRLHRRRLALS